MQIFYIFRGNKCGFVMLLKNRNQFFILKHIDVYEKINNFAGVMENTAYNSREVRVAQPFSDT